MQPYLLEELTEIYSTPTPKGGTRPVKSEGTILINVMIDVYYNSHGLIFIPEA